MRQPYSLLTLFLLVVANLAASDPPDDQVREAAAKAVALLQQSGTQFYRAQTCFACHHSGILPMALRRAREHGVPVDEGAARELALHAFNSPDTENFVSVDLAIQGPLLIDPGAAGTGITLLAGLEAGLEPTLVTAVHARRVADWQRDDGTWPSVDFRPPSSASLFTNTALAVRAVDLCLPEQLAAKRAEVVGRARRWFEGAEPRTTEDFTFLLYGLSWSGADPEHVRTAAGRLMARQRVDGGWSQLRSRGSDAYATAEALVALHEIGGIPTSDPSWQRGLRFLLDIQKPDGSWLVETRQVSPAIVSPPYFETGFPHGKHQFISAAATGWAITALSLSLPRLSDPPQPLPLPELEPKGVEPWMETAAFGSAKELEILVDGGLGVNSASADGTTLLMAAASDPEKVALLIDRGADVNRKAKTGFTALHVTTTHRGSAEAVRILLDAGAEAEPGRDVMFNASPLLLAAYVGDHENVSMLLKAGGDIERTMLLIGKIPVTPPLASIWGDHQDVLQELIRAGANVNEVDGQGMSLLSFAVLFDRPSLAETLIRLGADVNHVDQYGYTPALYAATLDRGSNAMLELLIEHGADLTLAGKDGNTALSNAQRLHYSEIVDLLERDR